MTLLTNFTQRLNESAQQSVDSTDVASSNMPFFAQMVKRTQADSAKKDVIQPPEDEKDEVTADSSSKLHEAFMKRLKENDDASTATSGGTGSVETDGILSKLKNLERQNANVDQDVITFGLEDDQNGTVKVTIKRDQAAEFERALQSILYDEENIDSQPEIAEVLFQLKDQFDIVNVVWPQIEEDEEPNVDMRGDEGNPEGELGGLGEEPPMEEPPMGGIGDDTEASSILTQVIDMMKADAEARLADARAREAEAKNREAEAIARQATDRVKQEEQMLDMEAQDKARKEEDREAKRLAQLSRWKSQNDDGGSDMDPGPFKRNEVEDEENMYGRKTAQTPVKRRTGLPGRVNPSEVASYVLSRVR